MKGKIFNAQEEQAIISGNKTMFREIVKRKKTVWQYKLNENGIRVVPCPYQVGQKIFCKESFCVEHYSPFLGVLQSVRDFKADWESGDHHFRQWKPAQHMKQEHSRLTLLIKEIRVERLQELTFGGAIREGASATFEKGYNGEMLLEKFKSNWNATHKKPGEKFEADPWVWCVSFEVINN